MSKVLLVEDCTTQCFLVNAELTKGTEYPCFLVTTVSTLTRAIEEGKTGDYDIVILDLNLPDAQGLETFKKFFTCCPALPVVIYTEEKEEILAIQAIAAGAQDFVRKTQTDHLPRALRYALERDRYIRNANRKIHNLKILYESIAEHNPDLIIRFDHTCKITYANKAFKQLVGDQLPTASVCLTDKSQLEPCRRIAELANTVKLLNPVVGPIDQDMFDRHISWVVTGVFNDDGNLIEYQAVGRDLTIKSQPYEVYFKNFTAKVQETLAVVQKATLEITESLERSEQKLTALEKAENE